MRYFIRSIAIIMIMTLSVVLCSCNKDNTQEVETTLQPQTEAPDLNSTHGYFDPEDHAKIYFRGQAYYDVCLFSGEMILPYLNGEAYITSKDVTDDSLAKSEGVLINFDDSQQIPDILRMATEDYFRDDNYEPGMYPDYKYFCKNEQWNILGQKIRTRVFENMYINFVEDKSLFGSDLFSITVGGHKMLDDETTEAIQSTVKNSTDDILDMDTVYAGDYSGVFIVHRCDKNMLVDPMNDEYMIIRTSDDKYYIGDWYSVTFNRVSQENEELIANLMEKYSDTVEMMTETFKELFFSDLTQAEEL